jgi:hypothetical protein
VAEFNAPQDWATLLPQLEAAVSSGSVDDFIDERLEQATVADGVPSAQPLGPSGDPTAFLLAALGVAQSESTQRDVAAALAQHGRTDDASVADALAAVYRSARSDPSRGPALLATLALRAEQDPVARSDLFGALLRLSSAESRYLLIRAAKIIGYFEGIGISTNARDKLTEWTDVEDLAVQGEARQQLALLALADALSQTDVQGVHTALHEARAAFTRAEATEEMRHDARLFGALLDVLLTHLETPGSGPEYSRAVGERAEALKSLIDDPSERPWAGYASPSERVLEYRLYRIAVGFIRVADEVGAMEEWTNFDASLTELAATWQLMWGRVARIEDSGQVITAPVRTVQRAERLAALPRMGSFLERAIGRQRIRRVVERHEAAFGTDDPVSEVLRTFFEAAGRAEYAREGNGGTLTIDTNAFVRLAANSPDVAAQIAGLMPGAEVALRNAGLDHVVTGPARLAYPVATDNPALYGNDPAVDETARTLLQEVAARLGPGYPLPLWRRFVDLTVSLIKIARDLRSDLPAFVLSAQERGGKGQKASEDDLQEYVFAVLRRDYGRFVHWEPTRIAGGRGDAGVIFPEGAFPIEVKAEYRNITREHVREAFLTQPDRYAADRDRLAYLLILDLREVNAGGEIGLYSLRQSFWVDGLPVDPQITGAQPNGVVVGLFPGNQPKPSSTTTYSRRPRSSR